MTNSFLTPARVYQSAPARPYRTATVRERPLQPVGALLLTCAALLSGCAALLSGCGGNGTAPSTSASTGPFREVSQEVGLNFRHFTGAAGEFFMPEIVGGGVALIDYDGDGDLDVYLIQGYFINPAKKLADALFPPGADWKPGNRLFRNELIPTGKLRFTDVTAQAGVGWVGEGMGVAVGDYNNDGFPDIYVTNFGPNVLYRNNGNGTFTDVTKEAGVEDKQWSTSAAFCDLDGDGKLDLFVAHYVNFPVDANPRCKNQAGERDYCGPKVFRPVPSRLYHNLGGGKFEDITDKAGINTAYGAGLGVACADFNRDGRMDLYVANDQNANILWINKGNLRFEDQALLAGAAYNGEGRALSGMGIAVGDIDNHGSEDILVTNLMGETNSFFRNEGNGFFHDATAEFGLAAASLPYTGFGVSWLDYDNDGLLDLYAVNGGVETVNSQRGKPYPYLMKNRLLHNDGGRKFTDVSDASGAALQLEAVGRGLAIGDLNNDGHLDMIATNNNSQPWVLINQASGAGHWLMVQLDGGKAASAEVGVLRKGQKTVWRRSRRDGSYISSSDPRVHFGLGKNAKVDGVVVRWVGGGAEVFRDIKADTIARIREGAGQPWSDTEPRP